MAALPEFEVGPRCFLRTFLKCMQDVHRLFGLGYIEDLIRSAFISDSDFLHARTHGWHRLPIIRLFSLNN